MNTHAVWVQMIKELDQFRRDKLTMALAFVLPVIALLMYGLAIRLETKDITVAIKNFDIGKQSRELVDSIYATLQLVPITTNSKDMLEPLDMTDAKASIVIPPDFSRNLKAGRVAHYQAIIDGTDINNARVVKNVLLATTQSFERNQHQNQIGANVQPAIRLWYNPGRKESLYIVPGAMALVLWIFPALLSTLAFVREKEQGTILQVYASNLTALEFVAGKTAAYLVVGMIESLFLIAVGMLVFDLRFVANPLPFVLCLMLYVASGVLFGIFAGTRAHSQMAAVQLVSNFGFLGTMLLSGFIYPIRNVVFPLSLVSYLVPAMYFVLVCRNQFVRGGPWLDLWYAFAFMAAYDLFFLFLCARMKMRLGA